MASLRRTLRAWTATFREVRRRQPYTLALGLLLLIPGTLGLTYGDDVSKALSNIAADHVSRGMGGAFITGAVLVLFGLFRHEPIVEVSGLVFVAMGAAIYGLGVILGLGLAGMVAGPLALAIALGTVFRIMNFTAATRTKPLPRHRARR